MIECSFSLYLSNQYGFKYYIQSIVEKKSMNNKLSYQKLQPSVTPKLVNKATNEQRFWKKYLTSDLLVSSSNINCISANANEKDLMLFSHGRTVSIVDTDSKQVIRTLDHYTFPVTALTIRNDGLIMATGDDEGRIQIKDTKQKFNLRTFDHHKKRINCLDYYEQDLYSAGEDLVIRLFDVAAGSVVHSYDRPHNDYIKCIKGLQNNHLLSGSYDGYIKLFDFRVHEVAQMQFNHGCQVQWFDLFPSKMNFVVCGDKKITSWDIRYTKPMFQNLSSKKAISCVRVISNGSRVISSSYDNYLKIYKSDSFEVTYQQKFQSPILFFDVSKNNQFIGLGLENKKIVMKSRAKVDKNDQQSQEQIEDQIANWLKNNEKKNKFAYNDDYFYRGIYAKPQTYDIKFQRNQNKTISQYDKCLKKFQYKKALLQSLKKRNMTVFLALVDEYQQRGCLDRTLKSLLQNQLAELLQHLSKLIHDIRYSEVCILLIERLTEIQGKAECVQWGKVKRQIEEQIDVIHRISQINGMIELIEKNCN